MPKLSPKTTTVEPFTFDERDKRNYERKQQKIKDIIAKEKKVKVCCLFQHDYIA